MNEFQATVERGLNEASRAMNEKVEGVVAKLREDAAHGSAAPAQA